MNLDVGRSLQDKSRSPNESLVDIIYKSADTDAMGKTIPSLARCEADLEKVIARRPMIYCLRLRV